MSSASLVSSNELGVAKSELVDIWLYFVMFGQVFEYSDETPKVWLDV